LLTLSANSQQTGSKHPANGQQIVSKNSANGQQTVSKSQSAKTFRQAVTANLRKTSQQSRRNAQQNVAQRFFVTSATVPCTIQHLSKLPHHLSPVLTQYIVAQ
jgi:hypothetical protein